MNTSYNFFSDTTHIISSSLWLISLISIFLFSAIAIVIFNRITVKKNSGSALRAWTFFIIEVAKKPFLLLFGSYVIYEILNIITTNFPSAFGMQASNVMIVSAYAFMFIEFIAFFWFVLNTLKVGQLRLELWAIKNEKPTLGIILPMVSNSLRAAVVFLLINMLIPALGLTGVSNEVFEKGARVALVVILAWLFVQLINGLEKLILRQYSGNLKNDPAARKINTQVLLLKKVIFSLGSVVVVAAILMVFDSVKNLGAGLLTTAGVLSAIGAFASQQSLGRIFSGLQIAFTQPIRIGDTVIVDGEFGQIEEITLSYIVVKVWDLRRLILPSDYFSNRGLQNLTRFNTELLGTIFLYVDYTLPIEDVRNQFKEILAQSSLWNGKVSNLQVTEIKDHCLELRALVSANDSSILWDLRCEVREKLIKYIVEKYPRCLPKARNLAENIPQKIEHKLERID